jgi:hypothetical protein
MSTVSALVWDSFSLRLIRASFMLKEAWGASLERNYYDYGFGLLRLLPEWVVGSRTKSLAISQLEF